MSIPIGYQDPSGAWKKIGDVPIPQAPTAPTAPPTEPTAPTPAPQPTKDKWGIQMLNPSIQTAGKKREWYLNETKAVDGQFYRKSGTIVGPQSDGSYSCDGAVRLYVQSPDPLPMWKNCEITGYYKIDVGGAVREAIQHYTGGGIHTNTNYKADDGSSKPGNPMGTKLSCRIYANGDVLSAKEIGHSVYAGYRGSKNDAVPDLVSPRRWFGWKCVFNQYTKNGKECRKLEGYIDDNAQDSGGKCTPKNNWKLMTSAVDEGDWNNYDQTKFDALIAQGALTKTGLTATQLKNMIITWYGHPNFLRYNRPIANCASFRWDNLTVRFKYLSAREIVPGA